MPDDPFSLTPTGGIGVGFHDIPAERYHSDPCERPSLSHSIAVKIVSESPWHAWSAHPRLGGQRHSDPTDVMIEGTAMHALLLGKGLERVAVIDAENFKTSAAQEEKRAALARGEAPLVYPKFKRLEAQAERIAERIRELGYDLSAGRNEVAMVWESEGVLCRAMVDHWNAAEGLVVDLKKVASANPYDLERAFVDYGDDVQDAAYREGTETLVPELAGRVRVVFLAFEPKSGIVVPVQCGGSMAELGQMRWHRGTSIWKRCVEANRWPAYYAKSQTEPIRLEAPNYAYTRETEGRHDVWI